MILQGVTSFMMVGSVRNNDRLREPINSKGLPSVAVVIPTYNYGRFISRAVESVLSQTLPAAEIVVVDDGSTDNTRAVLENFKDKVRYVRQENQGVCAARNTGARQSSAAFIAFADADDIWLPTKLEKQIAQFAADEEIGLVHCGMREFNSESGETVRFHLQGGEGWVADDLLLWEKPIVIGPGGTIVVKREAFDMVGGFDPQMKVGEDWDFCYRVARRFKLGFVPEVLVDYRSHGKNAHKNIAEMECGMKVFYEKAFAADEVPRSLKRRALGNYHRVLAGSYFSAGMYKNFLHHASRSLWERPAGIRYFLEFPIRKFRCRATSNRGKQS